MTPDPTNPRHALEASLTALLLGELPPDQAAFLRQAIAMDPELARMHARLERTIGLVRETAAEPAPQHATHSQPLKLSSDRREQLLRRFKTVDHPVLAKPERRERSWLMSLGIAAAFILLFGWVLLPRLASSRSKSQLGHGYKTRSFDNFDNDGGLASTKAPENSIARSYDHYSLSGQIGTPPAAAPAPPQTTIFLPPKLRESESELALTAKVLDGSTAGNSFFRVEGGMGGGGGGGAPAENRGLDEPREATLALSPPPAKEEALARRYGLRLPKSEAKEPQAQVGKPTVTYSAEDRKAGTPTFGTEVHLGMLTNAVVLPNTAFGPSNPLLQRSLDDSERLYAGRGDAAAEKPTLGDTPAPGTLFKEAPPQQKQEMAVEQGVNEAVPRLAYRIELRQRLADARDAESRKDLSKAAKLYDQASDLASKIGSENVKREMAQIRDGQAAVRAGAEPGQPVAAGQLGAAMPTPATSAATEPTTGLPIVAGVLQFDDANRLSKDLRTSEATNTPAAGDYKWQFPAGSPDVGLLGRNNPLTPRETAAAKDREVIEQTKSAGDATNAYSLNVVGYVNHPLEASTGSILLTATPITENARQYADAKTKLEELQHFDQVLRMKAAGEKTDLQLPKNSMVEIIDTARPVESPSLGQKLSGLFSSTVERKARIKVERDQSDIAATTGLQEKQTASGYDPYFVQTEAGVIQSEIVLGPVVDNLKLQEAWGKKRGTSTPLPKSEAVKMLKEQLDVKSVGKTDLLDIGVKSDKPEEAAKLANAVAQSYRAYRLEQRKKLSKEEIASLQARLTENEQQVREAQSNVDLLREKLQVPNSPAASTPRIDKSDDARPPKPTTPPPEPQPEIQTRDNSFSTFSLNVSDVSFKLAAASLEKGVLPEPASIRSEEFINAFDYRDPEPAPGAPIAFAWERARYPFTQNRDLLRFSLKTAALGRQTGRPLNLVLLLDNSGSMERADRVSIIREALRVLATQLQPSDTLSVVLFARTPRLWVDGVSRDQAGKIADEVRGLTPEGGTNLGDALDLAYQTALRHYLMAGINRVVLLTDGAANLGNVQPEELKKKVEANRRQGVALDCFGIGWEGYNDDLLEVLTRNGDGRYGFINTPEEAATEFAGQLAGALHVAASDVKVQVEFNPKRVTAYRQIGYAKHQLTKEQFRDNSVDAAELGAAESGNALYVVDVNGGGDGPLATVRVRYKVPGTMQYQEHEWTVPFTGNAAPLEQGSPALRLAASASAFSEWLATSPYSAEVTPDSVLGYLRGVPEVYGADARPKKLEWMIRQAKSLAGKQ